jgi:hypothetical protein
MYISGLLLAMNPYWQRHIASIWDSTDFRSSEMYEESLKLYYCEEAKAIRFWGKEKIAIKV